jgi:hypothetical protein
VNLETKISIAAATLTVIGTLVTLWQAGQVRRYRDQIKLDVRKITLAGVVDRLKRAQDDIRRLPTNFQNVQRGIKPDELIESIRGHFDFALSQLDAAGPEGDIRATLADSQERLNLYQTSWDNGAPSAEDAHALQSGIQDGLSTANSRIYRLEGKA